MNNISLETPKDLTQQLETWLGESRRLASNLSSPEVEAQLQAIEDRWQRQGFKLAFVGEFSRGKSTLINRLLNRDFLPSGATPTTASLTLIVAGDQDLMEVFFKDKPSEVRPINDVSWSDLLGTDSEGNSQDIIAPVKITLADPWLSSLNCELIDTPGIGDLSAQRADSVFDLLTECDATVLVVSANTPFSLSEVTLLEQNIIGHHVPRIIVVVSKLDTITKIEEKLSVFEYISQKVGTISANIPVLPSYPLDEVTTEAESLELVKTNIAAMVASSERQPWRSQQVARQILDFLEHLVKISEGAITAQKMTQLERELAVTELKLKIAEADPLWEEITLELEQRRLQHSQKFRHNLVNAKTDLLAQLSLELNQASNPKVWWSEKFALVLRRELVNLAQQSEGFLMQVIATDYDWLKKTVNRKFERELSLNSDLSINITKSNHQPNQLDTPELEQYRLLTRLGTTAAIVFGCLVYASIPIAITLTLGAVGALFIGEQMFDQQLKEQKLQIAKEMDRNVSQVIEEYCNLVSDRLRLLYSQLINETQREQILWQSALSNTISNQVNDTDELFWQGIIEQVTSLQQQINTALSQP